MWTPLAGIDIRVHTSTNLLSEDILLIDGIPTTSVARTLMSLGALVPEELSSTRLFELVSTALERRLATERWLWWTLARRRCRGRNGVMAFEEALAHRAHLGPTESWLEREILRILAAEGLPLPRVQRVVRRRGRFAARVDFAYDDGLVIEALGYAFHRSRADLERDTRRANELQLLGQRVLQFTFDQVTRDPRSVCRTVRSALAAPGHAAAA